ncbi:DUF4817 domain-containing protein [Trichonephila clavipes]|nr:DUF4817 domain-containing protein [Trichonephila clavipes]
MFFFSSRLERIAILASKNPKRTVKRKRDESPVTVQRLRDTGSFADRKRLDRAFILKTKVADVETTLQRSPLKRPSVYINIITKLISLLQMMKGTLGCSKTEQFITHHRTSSVIHDLGVVELGVVELGAVGLGVVDQAETTTSYT